MNSRVVVFVTNDCKPGEIKLSTDLSKSYNDIVSKTGDGQVPISVVRYGVIMTAADLVGFKPKYVTSSEKGYCEMNIADAISIRIDVGGDVISVIFDERS